MSPLPSSRFPASFEPNPLTLAVRRARATGRPLLDLTLTNPTRAGFAYPLGSAAVLELARGADGTNPNRSGFQLRAVQSRRTIFDVARTRIPTGSC